MISPLQLDSVRLLALHFEASEDFEPGEAGPNVNLGIDFDVHGSQEALRFRIPLRIVVTPAPEVAARSPLQRLDVKVEGDFSVQDGTPEEEWRRLVPVNAVAMLYSVIRGLVLNCTASAPGGPVLLPTVNIVQVVRDVATRKAQELQGKAGEIEAPRPRKATKRGRRLAPGS